MFPADLHTNAPKQAWLVVFPMDDVMLFPLLLLHLQLWAPSLLDFRLKPDWEGAAPLFEKAALAYKVA